MRAVRAVVTGRVHGVGFRYSTQREAQEMGLTGWVRNRSDGTVDAGLYACSPKGAGFRAEFGFLAIERAVQTHH